MATMLSAVKTEPRKLELREVPLPEIDDDSALMKIEAAGMCSAYASFVNPGRDRGPGMSGHENAGIIVKAGKSFKLRHGVEEGDFVAMEEYLACGHCEFCRIGEFRHCWATDTHNNPQAVRLAGGYSQYLYLPPNSVLHHVPSHVTPSEAALALPIGNGVQWACKEGEAGPGKTIVVQGPGSKGLGCVLAAKIHGAETVIVTGLTKDQARFDAARQLGADYTLDVQQNDFKESIMEITHGRGVDAVVDCTSGHHESIFLQTFDVLKRRGGIVVTQSYELKSEFPLQKLADHYVTLRMCRGHNYASVATALEWIASGKYPLKELITHHYRLDQTDIACLASGGEGEGENAAWVMVNPWS
jgi:threonine dehydrogenase-like Zn-dependent dehydrogenase